jgi:signal transduction histidine kinase/CheY-like chemotaxis protein/HPt (histidine-containing phosphotransfer) domain-containing protein
VRRRHPPSIRGLFGALLAVVMLLAAGLFSVTVLEHSTASQRTAVEHQRVTGFLLSDQMRQSSNDLTEMVRLYVTTGNQRYRRYYFDILAIRAGTAPRPVDYDSSFWDRRLADPAARVRYGQPVSLPALVRQAGFTGKEFRALDNSLIASNTLAQLEERVMNAVAPLVARGVGPDFPTEVEPYYRQLVNANYFLQKGSIMASIKRFTALLDAHAAARETSLQHRTATLLVIQTVMLALLSVTLLATLTLASRLITRPLARLTSVTRRIAGGDWSERAPAGGVAELRFLAENFDEMSDAVQSDLAARRRAEEAAASADRAKSAFLAMTSHELRTPLVAVTGTLELLELGQLGGDERHLVEIASRSAQTLLSVIGEVLDFSKIEAGHLDLTPVPTAVGRLAEDVVTQHRLGTPRAGVEVQVAVDPRLAPEHEVDPGRLRQVLGNLLSNALKFTAAGWVRLQIEVLADDRVTQRLGLSVQDTGVGISAENQQRLFRPFEQAREEAVTQPGGTGLGLVICRQLVEAMGGTVTLESELGVGTTLRVDLTLAVAAPERSPAPPDGVADRRATARFGRPPARRARPTRDEAIREGSLLLLVEDHPVNRDVLVRSLGMIGFVADTAADATEALERFESGSYGLVFTDVELPGASGRELTRRLRALESRLARPRIPVIALTAHALAEERDRCLEAGMDDLVVKPATLVTLAATLRQWLPACPWPEPTLAESPSAVSEAQSPSATLDSEVLDTLTGDDPALRASIVEHYLRTLAEDLAALSLAQRDGDLDALGSQAHRIFGAGVTVGAGAVTTAAKALERAVRTPSDPAQLAGCYVALARVGAELLDAELRSAELQHAGRGSAPA